MKEKIQTSFKLDPNVHKDLRIICAIKGKRVQFILESLVKDFVQKNKSELMK